MGASTCASGSQVWNGNIGTLMAKASAKAANSHICSAGRRPACAASAVQVEGLDARSRGRAPGTRPASARCRPSCRGRTSPRRRCAARGPRSRSGSTSGSAWPPRRCRRGRGRASTKTPIMPASSSSMKTLNSRTRSVDRRPGAEQRERRQERGEDHEPEAEPVDAHVVGDAVARAARPRIDLELHARPAARSRAPGASESRKTSDGQPRPSELLRAHRLLAAAAPPAIAPATGRNTRRGQAAAIAHRAHSR